MYRTHTRFTVRILQLFIELGHIISGKVDLLRLPHYLHLDMIGNDLSRYAGYHAADRIDQPCEKEIPELQSQRYYNQLGELTLTQLSVLGKECRQRIEKICRYI